MLIVSMCNGAGASGKVVFESNGDRVLTTVNYHVYNYQSGFQPVGLIQTEFEQYDGRVIRFRDGTTNVPYVYTKRQVVILGDRLLTCDATRVMFEIFWYLPVSFARGVSLHHVYQLYPSAIYRMGYLYCVCNITI